MWKEIKAGPKAGFDMGKAGFDKGWGMFEKLGAPVNKLTNKIGSEAFWPTTMDKECDKAARILKSFCKDGFYKDPEAGNQAEIQAAQNQNQPQNLGQPQTSGAQQSVQGKQQQWHGPWGKPKPLVQTSGTQQQSVQGKQQQHGPKGKPMVLVKIPQKVIQNCVGLAIFTTMRTGLWISAAGGSGVLVAKGEDGRWSPPSGILVHTLGAGFLAGIDIYDCVIVINNRKALDEFTRVRLTLGGELSAAVGPVGIGGVAESTITNRAKKPLFSYMKSRGLYGGAQVDGTIIIERNDENARFYGQRVRAKDILSGTVVGYPTATRNLIEVLKSAEGRQDVDQGVMDEMAGQPAPSDLVMEQPSRVPNAEEKQYFGTENVPDHDGPPRSPPFLNPSSEKPSPMGPLPGQDQAPMGAMGPSTSEYKAPLGPPPSQYQTPMGSSTDEYQAPSVPPPGYYQAPMGSTTDQYQAPAGPPPGHASGSTGDVKHA